MIFVTDSANTARKIVNDPRLLRYWLRRRLAHIFYYTSFGGYAFPPLCAVTVMVNNRCNLRCRYCDIGQKQDLTEYYKNTLQGRDMPVEVFAALVRDIKRYAFLNWGVAINGMEPLLHHDLAALLKVLVDERMHSYLLTNGYLLEDHADDIARLPPDFVNVSLDGPPAVHNAIAGVPDSFEKAYAGIRALLAAKEKRKRRYPAVYVAYTITPMNAGRLMETVALFKGMKIDGFKFIHLNYITPDMARRFNESFHDVCAVSPSTVQGIDPEEMDVDALFDQIRTVKKQYPYAFFSIDFRTREELVAYYRDPGTFLRRRRCLSPWMRAQVLSSGDVIAEARCFHPVIGNIHQTKFSELWNGEALRRVRKKLKSAGATPVCSRCFGILR